MVGRATLARCLCMVGLVVVGISTLSQHMHFECGRRRVMDGRGTLAQRPRMVGLDMVGILMSSPHLGNICISMVREVG